MIHFSTPPLIFTPSSAVFVALINAMFTIGAFVTPMLVAASLHYLADSVWPAFHVLSFCAISAACSLPFCPSPRSANSRRSDAKVRILQAATVVLGQGCEPKEVGREGAHPTATYR